MVFMVGIASLSGCGTTVGNGATSSVTFAFKAFSQAGIASDDGSLSELVMCVKRLRFKPTESDPGANVDFPLGEVALSPAGTNLAALEVPTGTYLRIELDLDSHCGSSRSLRITNSHGSFVTDSGVTLRFQGHFEVTSGLQTVNLGVQAIVRALRAVTQDSELRDTAESASGDY
jgi:hypothetical protein